MHNSQLICPSTLLSIFRVLGYFIFHNKRVSFSTREFLALESSDGSYIDYTKHLDNGHVIFLYVVT